jgi:hypothetical protein
MGLRRRRPGGRAVGNARWPPAAIDDMTAPATRLKWFVVPVLCVAAGALYLAYELGRYRSGYSIVDHRRERAALVAKLAEEQAASEELRRQLAIGQTASEIDRATYAQVESELASLQAKIQEQEEELGFYRGIVSPQDRVAGLRIQSFEASPSDGESRYLVRLLLVQAIVHNRRVAGAVKLQLEGMQDGQTASFDAAELVAQGQSYDMDYEFRYFQGLETELALPVGFEPQRMTVEIWPSEARAERISQTFDWPVAGG